MWMLDIATTLGVFGWRGETRRTSIPARFVLLTSLWLVCEWVVVLTPVVSVLLHLRHTTQHHFTTPRNVHK